ncbi:uncharacterized protein LOC126859401 [Cataglyphis hispanica]|uniref:uncharacterized protein LOC126859401 n=1 Tax=Cataglyphis hispanica TaxID=1086592 RepID=UPI00217F47E3|nr:uncharacterized protein LOC126859401 [Cataglyphis hispanica]
MEMPGCSLIHSALGDGMCITMRVAWLTMDRLRSGRDIRLSAATMRALNSRRSRSTTSIHRLVPCTSLCFLLLLCVLHDVRARSVLYDDGDVIADQVHDKILEPLVKVSDPKPDGVENADQAQRKSLTDIEGYDNDEDVSVEERKHSAVEILNENSDKIQIEAGSDEGSVAKKRRRNDVSLPGKFVLQDKEENVQKDEGIRRFDAQIEPDDIEEPGQQKIFIEGIIPSLQKEANDREKQLINVEQSHTDVKNVEAKPSDEDEAGQEGKKYAEISSDLRESLENVASLEQIEKIDLNKEETGPIENLVKHNLDEARTENVDNVNEEIRNDLRSLKLVHANESERNQEEHVTDKTTNNENIDLDPNREDRHLASVSAKSKYKSSTVYLNAEEGKLPGREQESIVNGQIKKLISIRDDALESIDNDAKQSEKVDQEGLLSEKLIEIDVTEKDEEIRNQRSSELKDKSLQNENLDPLSLKTEVPNRLQKWKAEATLLQIQIKNGTFPQYLQEQAIDVLSDIPKFTENQLLETLNNIALSRKSLSNETYLANLNATELSKNQLEIIKCAEQLIQTKERQSFVANMAECIRGLSVLNCMRIFVWPIILDNLPERISDSLNNLPIEINLIDLFQGNRTKSARSESSVHRPRLLTPESIVFSILSGALDSKATYDQAPTFIDPKNETLRRLLTIGQLQILQMAEKLLPGEIRREYSDRMFSCVRRFEYFSCVKYFAWPMVKQYHPALPAFPDYQSWYPSIPLYPQYPIVPFPNFAETSGELPEVVDADATRMRKPEAVIINILENTLKAHVKTPPPSVHYADSYVAILPPEQLLSIQMAEQLLPVPYRPEFVQKTVKCIQELNYMTCIKYSTWPTIKQLYPSLPDLSGRIPFLSFSDFFGYLSSNFPNFASIISGLGIGGNTTTEQPPASSNTTTEESPGRLSTILLRQNKISSKESSELENRVTEILTGIRNSLRTISENSHLVVNGNTIVLATITEKQINILKLAENIVPPPARAPLVAQVLSCLQTNNDFLNCTRYVIWPTVALYVSNFPEFPDLPSKQDNQVSSKDKNALHPNITNQQELNKSQNEANSNVKIISRTKFPQNNSPVISVTGTRFVPIFTEHPESVILNILRSIQLSSPNVRDDHVAKLKSTLLLADELNDRQLNIVNTTEGLLPDAVRPAFVDRMTECIRKNNFLACSRNILWPTLSEYFPRLPNFPNFEAHSQATNVKSILRQNLTDSSPLSEIDVKVGQHGDATVTITDTRFYPIFSEHPEGVILKILKAIQSSTPGVMYSMITSRLPETMSYFTEQQANIVYVAESLLPESVRSVFVEQMINCIRENTFLDCTRDITWPTIAQFFPRLPNFPDFGSQNVPRTKFDSSSSLLYNSESATSNENTRTAVDAIEDKIENILKELNKDSTLRLEGSYLDINNPIIRNLLTVREMNIVRLTEKAIPDSIRPAYVNNMLECMRSNNFITCTQQIAWPTLKQFSQALPNFEELFGQFQLPGAGQSPVVGQIPIIGQLPATDQISGISQFPGIGQIPGVSQISGIGQFSDGSQIPGAGQIQSFPGLGNPFAGPSLPQQYPFPQIPMVPSGIQTGIPQFPGFSNFGSINYPQFAILSDTPQTAQEQTILQSTAANNEKTNQMSGTSRATKIPSVDEQGIVPGYLGQPLNILIDISKEKIQLSDIRQQQDSLFKSVPVTSSFKKHERRRRNADELLNSHYKVDKEIEPVSEMTINNTFPNITESEFLQLLINISNFKKTLKNKSAENPKEYFVDTLNSTIKNSLTADQYEILKMVEDFNEHTANRGFMSQVTQCILSLSFIRCIGIFVWPMIVSALPGLSFLGRSTETEVERFFGMSTNNFERELLMRKESMENVLLDWYKKAMEDKFQTNLGFLTIKGYGNGEIGISFSGFREGRATKIKDNKNLPSILTIISDIMEEVLDQRPDNEKLKKEKEKRERSLDNVQETDFQFLKDNDEYADIKRSINDDQIITMFLDKIKANATDFADSDVAQFFSTEDAYNAFGELFGTRLNEKFEDKLKIFTEEHLKKNNPDDHMTKLNAEELKMMSLKGEPPYNLEKESLESHEERKRQHRAKNEFRSLLDKYSLVKKLDIPTEKIEDSDNENKIKITEPSLDRKTRSELRIQLPRLREDIMSRKITSTVIYFGRALKTKMSSMMPGIGLLITFLIQTALAHARAAASVAGMISNIALASAMFGMIRQNFFGSENQNVKYVYDNDKTGPGISWPHHHRSYHHGK